MRFKILALRIVVVIFTIVCIHSCAQTTNKEEKSDLIQIKLHPNDIPPFKKLSDVIESVRIIPLETSSEIIMGNIGNSYIGEKYMVFVSYSGTIDIYLFTEDGEFIRKIGQNGTGPAEYGTIGSISVLEEEELIFVHGILGGPIVSYSFSGEFIKSFKPPENAINSIIINPDVLAATCYGDHEILIINSDKHDTLRFIPINGDNYSCEPEFSHSYDNGILYSGVGRDTIYKVTDISLDPILGFDFGEGHILGKVAKQPSRLHPPNKISIILGSYQCGSYYQTTIQHSQNQGPPMIYSTFINRLNQEVLLMNVFEDSDDVLFSSGYRFLAVSPDDELVEVIDALDLIDALPRITDNSKFEYTDQLISQIRSLKAEDNAVIVLYNLK